MHKAKFFAHIQAEYAIEPDYPWQKNPTACVFRHITNQKWFCLYMEIANKSLGRLDNAEEIVAIMNVKAKPEMIGSLRQLAGVLPAYHMNKEHWLTLVINEIDKDLLWQLIDDSFALTF